MSHRYASSFTLEEHTLLKEYYGIMGSSLGLLTAFASDVYFMEKASSSVAAALLCGVPLVTPKRTLETYTYLTEVRHPYLSVINP